MQTTYFSLSDVARHFSQPLHRISYIACAYDIPPRGRLGGTRYWDESQLSDFRKALAAVASKRLPTAPLPEPATA